MSERRKIMIRGAQEKERKHGEAEANRRGVDYAHTGVLLVI